MICLIQLLCPARHAILAGVFDMAKQSEADAIAGLKQCAKQISMNPFCGICGSTVLVYECKVLPFNTITEALPYVIILEQANLETRARLEAAGATYDHQRKN